MTLVVFLSYCLKRYQGQRTQEDVSEERKLIEQREEEDQDRHNPDEYELEDEDPQLENQLDLNDDQSEEDEDDIEERETKTMLKLKTKGIIDNLNKRVKIEEDDDSYEGDKPKKNLDKLVKNLNRKM